MTEASARAVFHRYLERHAANDLAGVLALFGAHATVEDPVGSPRHEGLEAIRDFYRATHERNGRLELETVGPVIVCGDELAAHVRAGIASRPDLAPMDVVYTVRLDADARIVSLRAWF